MIAGDFFPEIFWRKSGLKNPKIEENREESKKIKKRRLKIHMRAYTASPGITNKHEVKVGGMRNPYYFQVSRKNVAPTLPPSGHVNPHICYHFNVAGCPIRPRGEAGDLEKSELLGQEEVVVFFPHR